MSEHVCTFGPKKLRLYTHATLSFGATFEPTVAQTHYLLHVMRLTSEERILLFNGRDGEWLARVSVHSRRSCSVQCEHQTAQQCEVPDIWLCFAPIKKTPADYLAQKATELGVRVLQPVLTRRTVVKRINDERMGANAIEAAEQCGRLTVPEIRTAISLQRLLETWPIDRALIFCDEAGVAKPLAHVLKDLSDGPFGIITGPEGGFTAEERDLMLGCGFVTPVTLGLRILRADTAALAALSIWQAVRGDWR